MWQRVGTNVPVIRLARQNARFTGTTYTFLTAIFEIDLGLKQRLVLGNGQCVALRD